jgi:hypothetical protein
MQHQLFNVGRESGCALTTNLQVDRIRNRRVDVKAFTGIAVLPIIVIALIVCIIGGMTTIHRRHLRASAEAGLHQELMDNNDGVQELRQALPTEMKNIAHVAELLQQRKLGHEENGQSARLGLQVMSFTNANWQAASATGAVESMNYGAVEKFAGAYFEQARLAQVQTSTLDAMMALSSYIGQGERLASLTPEQASLAEVQAQLLLAHLHVMLRMTDGVEEAYKAALIES